MADSMFTTSGRRSAHGAGVKKKSKRKDDGWGAPGRAAASFLKYLQSTSDGAGSAGRMRSYDNLTPYATPMAGQDSGSGSYAADKPFFNLLEAVGPGKYTAPPAPERATPVGGLLAGSGLSLTPAAKAGLADSWKMLTAPKPSPSYLSVDDVTKLALASLPQAPKVSAGTIDIGAIQRLYDQGKAAANKAADTARTDLTGLLGQANRQLDLSKTAQGANTRASITAQTSAAANNALGAAGDFQGSVDMLRQNGVDPAMVADLVRAQGEAARQASAAGSLGTDLTAANNATAMQVAEQQGFDNKMSDTNARRDVDKNLVAALLGLDSKRTEAVASAQAQNAAAVQQAAQANYQADMERMAAATQVRQQLLDRAAQDGALYAPGAKSALDAAASHGKSGDYFGQVLALTLQAAADNGEMPTATGFMKNLDSFLAKRKSELGFKKSPWDRNWYRDLAKQYFTVDPSKIDAGAAKRYLASLG